MTRTLQLMILTVVSQFAIACRDSSSPPGAPQGPVAAATAGATARAPRIPVTPTEFHARNKMDWVGVAHNRAMDRLREEVRRSRPKDVCKVIERLGVDDDVNAHALGRLSRAEVSAIGKSVSDQIGCRGPRGGFRHAATTPGVAFGFSYAAYSSQTGELQLSGEAWALVDRVMAAGGSNAGEVASELAAITSEAQALSADEASIVEAMASVSLSSFEYWEQNAEPMFDAMASAYEPCFEAGGGDSCYYAMSRRGWAAPSAGLFRLAANMTGQSVCIIDTGTIWSGDKYGAGVGLAIGLRYGGVVGAIVGVFAGAAVGSGGAAAYEFGRWLHCAYK